MDYPEDTRNPRQRKLARKTALWTERSSWMHDWREISQFMQPRLGRFLSTEANKGDRRANHILDLVTLRARRVLAAGMMSGMTSPARPWFRFGLRDKQLAEAPGVKAYLHDSAEVVRAIFSSSNTYNALHQLYGELPLFGSAVSVVVPNFQNVIHHHPLTIGEYAFATNHDGVVDTLVREFPMTVSQMVKQFGISNCSETVQNMFRSGLYDAPVNIVHMVEPNMGRNMERMDNRNMPFSSCYFEPSRDDYDRMLSSSGFKRFRALCPRWDVVSNDVYGTGPGAEALGAVKQLQFEHMRKAQAIDYKVNPPLQIPSAYKNQTVNRLPGGTMYVDAAQAGAGIRSAFEVNLDLSHLLADIQDVRAQIEGTWYTDLFLMLANDTRSGVTATEVAERHEEKLLMLGPVLERLQTELLKPMVDMAFDDAAAAGILPEPPPELENMEIEIEYISVLAQAQRAVAAAGADRLFGAVGQFATLKPEVLDKVDFDQAVDDYADMYGVNPKLIVPDDVVAKKRAARAQREQQAQTAAAMPQTVETAKTAGEINTQGVQDVMNLLQGYSTPSPSQV